MAELTPIPAAHRAIYHEALRAGLAEAERRELDLDALPFAEFHRALYRPLLDAHEAEVRAKVAEDIAKAVETKRGDRCPECGGKPYSSKALRSIPPRIRMKCGGGHTWDVPGGLAAHPNQWCATDAAAIARQHATTRPEDPSHGNSAHIPGEQQQDRAGNPAESHVQPRTGVATPKDTPATPQTAQAV